jgi:single-strand DNA-binding protein
MLIGNLYGRLGADPVARQTKNGHAMATASVAVDVTAWQAEEPETLWVSMLCFGVQADVLLRANKGEMIVAIGKLTRHDYTHPETGEMRENWTMVAESVMTMTSARPPGGRQKKHHHHDKASPSEDDPSPLPEGEVVPDFDDAIPF